MKILLDTHLLLWAANAPEKLRKSARRLIENGDHQPIFSAASIWEIAIKSALRRKDFAADPALVRRGLLDNGYEELPVTGAHAVAGAALPSLHKDPFDRLLIAQAIVEGTTLLTSDTEIAAYPGPIRKV